MKHFLQVSILALSFPGLNTYAQGSYAPGAGNTGSTAIYMDSSIIKSWATGIELQRGWVNIADTSVKYNGTNKASFGYPSIALNKAKGTSYDIVSLGDSGVAILTFSRPIVNGAGSDFAIFENGFSNNFLELAFVEVSSDGMRFVRFPAVSLTPSDTQVGGFGSLDPTNLNNLAGKYKQGYGTPFDLEDIKDSMGIDLNNVRFVKIIDVVGSINRAYASHDSKGNIVNDPWPTPYNSCGFDLDGIGVCNGGQQYNVATFDDLTLGIDSRWQHPVATDTTFVSTGTAFSSYVDNYNIISGFSYSNMRNDSTAGYTNDYSAITRGGMNAVDTGGTNYAVAYVNTYSTLPTVWFTDKACHKVHGFYVTNNTYAYLSMKNGDSYAKKFGGTSGNDPDYFKLQVWGEKEDGSKTDTIDFYLADFRFSDNSKDYIVKDWRWVDVSSLGAVKTLRFNLSSSDNGTYGMNTPAYFCLDNLTVQPNAELELLSPLADVCVKKNATPVVIALGSAFTAYDTTGIKFAITSNSNLDLVQTNLSGKSVTLSFTPDKTGEAQIIVSATLNNQILSSSFKVTVTNTTNIHETYANNIKVYPNPSSSNITVECEANSLVTLFDLFGRKIIEQKTIDNSTQFLIEGIASGYYVLQVVNKSNTQTIKILKQ